MEIECIYVLPQKFSRYVTPTQRSYLRCKLHSKLSLISIDSVSVIHPNLVVSFQIPNTKTQNVKYAKLTW